jgi:TetR/AcrR family transcriptional regulator, tetracycline repressor protein
VALERNLIVREAIKLLDEKGLPGLSLRTLADRLGVQVSALYWHVRNKQELLDYMVGAIAEADLGGTAEPRPGQSWQDWFTERARAMRHSMLAHRDGALLAAGARPPTARLDATERVLKMLTDNGFAPTDAFYALLTLGQYVSGFVTDEERNARRPAPGEAPEVDRFPTLLAAAPTGPDYDKMFEFGLAVLIAGMEAQRTGGRVTTP